MNIHPNSQSSFLLLGFLLTLPAGADATEKPELDLVEAIRTAAETHPALEAAEAQALASAAVPEQVASWEDPVVSVAAGIPFKSPGDPPLVEAKVSQTLPLSPVHAHKKKAAEAQAGAMGIQVAVSELDVALAVATTYYEIVFLEELREVAGRQLELAGSIVEAATLRFSSLAGNQADVVRARIAYEEIETEIAVMDIDIATARQTLVLLLGDGRDPDGFSVSPPGHPLVTKSAGELASLAIENRPELDFLDAKSSQHAAELKVAKAGWAPKLVLTAGYQYKSNSLEGLMGQDAFAVGAAVNIPLMVGKHKGAQDEAAALLMASESSKKEAVLLIESRTLKLRSLLSGLEKKIDLQEQKVIPESRLALDLTLAAYAAQGAGITDVLSALEKLLVAERRRTELRGTYLSTFALLMREVGSFEAEL